MGSFNKICTGIGFDILIYLNKYKCIPKQQMKPQKYTPGQRVYTILLKLIYLLNFITKLTLTCSKNYSKVTILTSNLPITILPNGSGDNKSDNSVHANIIF